MNLNGKQRRQFYEALLKAFPTEKELARMVNFQLGQNLAAIAGSGNLSNVIFDLIQWADSRGKTAKLVAGAIEENPDSPVLQDFAKQFGIEIPAANGSDEDNTNTDTEQSGNTKSSNSDAVTQPVQPIAKTELHIEFSSHNANTYHVEIKFDQQDSATTLTDSTDIAFDIDQLRALQLDHVALGHALGSQLFDNRVIEKWFNRAQGATGTDAMRIRFSFDNRVAALHDLPWETLWYPTDDIFLTKNGHIFFSRYINSPNWAPVDKTRHSNLGALVVISNPSDLDSYGKLAPIAVEQELQQARDGLGSIFKNSTSLDSGGKANIDKIIEQLHNSFPILYLVAHGSFNQKQDGPVLWLEQDDGTTDVVDGSVLVRSIRHLRPLPLLVVLASCQSAGGSDKSWRMNHAAWQGASALAIQLSEAGIPAVLAMQGNITMKTISQFIPRFFAELQKHGEIDRAVSVARSLIGGDRHDWWMPVLFMSMRDGRLWSE